MTNSLRVSISKFIYFLGATLATVRLEENDTMHFTN